VALGWWRKGDEDLKAAQAEGQKTRVGRRARISGMAEYVAAPSPSLERLDRRLSRPETS
jgi:hypothetical protein